MSAIFENKQPLSTVKRFNQTTVHGKIEGFRRFNEKYYTRVLTPAEDAYSRPQVLDLRSDKRVGQKGEEITVDCKIGGYNRKSFKATDKDTGEISNVVMVEHTFDVIE